MVLFCLMHEYNGNNHLCVRYSARIRLAAPEEETTTQTIGFPVTRAREKKSRKRGSSVVREFAFAARRLTYIFWTWSPLNEKIG
jgi:hypothetical protein